MFERPLTWVASPDPAGSRSWPDSQPGRRRLRRQFPAQSLAKLARRDSKRVLRRRARALSAALSKPPRLVPETGITDTLQAFNNLSYQAQSTSFFVNPYAAMPSLHVGWSVLLGLGVALAFGRRYPWVLVLCVLHPLTQSASTVFTGNHYFLDGAAGLVAAAFGLGVAYSMQRWGYPRLSRLL